MSTLWSRSQGKGYSLKHHVLRCLCCCPAIPGVSAQSFIHAFTLTSSAFNVFLATPEVIQPSYIQPFSLSLSLVSGTRPSEKRMEDLGNRLGRKCTLRNAISVNYLPANAGLEDFYSPHSGCTLISGKRLTV